MNKIIKLKLLSEVDITKLFPVIDPNLYKLLEGKEITLNISQLREIKSNKYFSLGGMQISKDLIELPKLSKAESIISSVKAYMNNKAIFMDDMIESVVQGIILEKNVMLYGRGGHNKSEGILQVLDFLFEQGIISSKPFIKSLGDGTTVEDLFGGVKMKQAMEEGIIEYNTENSFMEHEIVIFEECFDAPSQVLLALKDIMTSGQFRNGNQTVDIKTKVFFALTNRSKKEISTDDSIEALAQRFSITCLVEWGKDNYTKSNFLKLFKLTRSKEDFDSNITKLNKLAKLCEDSCKTVENFISPRSAINASHLYCNGGSLKFISEFDPKLIEIFEKEGGSDDYIIEEQTKHYKELVSYVEENNLLKVSNNAATKLLSEFANKAIPSDTGKYNKINFLLGVIANVSWHHSLQSTVDSLNNRLVTASKS